MDRIACIGSLALLFCAVACGGGGEEDAQPDDENSQDANATGTVDPAEKKQIEDLLSKVPGTGADKDGDGIDDMTEELLLRRYRPYVKFSKNGDGKDEANRPADPIAIMKNAQLKQFKGDGDGSTDPLSGCGKAPDYHLNPVDQIFTCRKDTSFLTNFTKTNYTLNVADADYGGVSFDEYKKNATGFFGHVAKDTVNGHDAYKIEYWQYYAFNNQDIGVPGFRDFGDHEGDWTGLQIWFDKKENRVAQVLYLIHGKKAWFHLTADQSKTTCTNCFATVKGPKYNAKPGNFFDDKERADYDDNQIEFFVDASGYKHVVAYVENGGHENWPFAFGHADIDVKITTWHPNPHKGDGPAFLVAIPSSRTLNAGEVEKPFSADYGIILQYNGYWGSTNTSDLGIRVRKSPPGPASHCEWKFPNRGSVPHCEN